ncbi:MAG: hypothetical protein ACTTH7_10055 [Treponema sp.]
MDKHNCKTVGIGKLILKKKINDKGNIPYLHFIVEKDSDNEYTAINLELLVTASGDTVNEAIANLSHITISYINDVLQTANYAGLIELVKSSAMEKYWAKYRELEFKAAEYGKDLGHTIDEDIQSRLLRIINDKALEKAAECLSKEMVEMLRDMYADIYSLSVSYTEIEAA